MPAQDGCHGPLGQELQVWDLWVSLQYTSRCLFGLPIIYDLGWFLQSNDLNICPPTHNTAIRSIPNRTIALSRPD
jgi:hypothetical protein